MQKEKKADLLLQIIEGMSGDERRYFKMNAGRYQLKGDNPVVELFDACCDVLAKSKGVIPDFEKVNKALKNPLGAAALSNLKARLKKQVQQSLGEKNTEDFSDVHLLNELHQARLMKKRNFYMESYSMVQAVLARSIPSELFNVTALAYQELIELYSHIHHSMELNLLDLIGRHRIAVQQYQNLCWIQQQSALLGHTYLEGALGASDERYQRMNELATSPDLNDAAFAQSSTARYFQLSAMILHCHKTKNYERFEKLSGEMIELMRPVITQSDLHLQRYYVALAEGIIACMPPPPKVEAARPLLAEIHRLWATPEHRKTMEANYAFIYDKFTAELYFYERDKDKEKLLKTVDECTAAMEKLSRQLPPSNCVYLYYLLARMNLNSKRINECLDNVRAIQGFVNTGAWPDVVNSSFILEILLQYQLGNEELAETMLRRAQRHFKNYYGTPDKTHYIWHVATFMRQLFTARSAYEKEQTLKAWLEFLKEYKVPGFNDLQSNLTDMSLSRSWLRKMLG